MNIPHTRPTNQFRIGNLISNCDRPTDNPKWYPLQESSSLHMAHICSQPLQFDSFECFFSLHRFFSRLVLHLVVTSLKLFPLGYLKIFKRSTIYRWMDDAAADDDDVYCNNYEKMFCIYLFQIETLNQLWRSSRRFFSSLFYYQQWERKSAKNWMKPSGTLMEESMELEEKRG